MNDGIVINGNLIIPYAELEITTSRSSGAGGQHVNKTDTRVTVRWNVLSSAAITQEQRNAILEKLASKITQSGDLLISKSESRSQSQNKKSALKQLALDIKGALKQEKKRLRTAISQAAKDRRMREKQQQKMRKESRKIKIDYE